LIREQLAETGSGNVALLFGSEKRGLSNDDLSHCHWLMHIPTSAENLSMNLGQAVAVCLYELVRDTDAQPIPAHINRADSDELERITTVLTDALLTSGYTDEKRKVSTEHILRRLVRRMEMSSEDAVLLTGMLRQILWKAKASTRPARGSSSTH
jgi:tRNA/rRNA methyltransferase